MDFGPGFSSAVIRYNVNKKSGISDRSRKWPESKIPWAATCIKCHLTIPASELRETEEGPMHINCAFKKAREQLKAVGLTLQQSPFTLWEWEKLLEKQLKNLLSLPITNKNEKKIETVMLVSENIFSWQIVLSKFV